MRDEQCVWLSVVVERAARDAWRSLVLGGALLMLGRPVLAQPRGVDLRVRALGYLVATRADPTPEARAETEVRLVQPVVMVDVQPAGWLAARLTLSFVLAYAGGSSSSISPSRRCEA